MDSLQQLACATCAAALMALPAFADTINVPGDFATIQAALDAAENGDEVIVAAGAAYSERKGISYAAWREIGVPAAVLKRAGISRSNAG